MSGASGSIVPPRTRFRTRLRQRDSGAQLDRRRRGDDLFTYNAAGQVATVDDQLTTTGVTTYTYDGTGAGQANTGRLLTRTDAQANLAWDRTYEAYTGRLDTQTIKNGSAVTLASFDLGYDAASDVTSKASSVFSNASNATWTCSYDPAHRLTSASGKWRMRWRRLTAGRGGQLD